MIRVRRAAIAKIATWIGERLETTLGPGAARFVENGRLLAGIHYSILSRP
jgi:hypothetical protein